MQTDHGDIDADRLILATGSPILDRGGYFAKLKPTRSYVLSYRVPGAPEAVPQGIYLSADEPGEGEGQVFSLHGGPVARSTVDGVTCQVSAVCPHLKGVVSWNDAEKSWDCPLHGSRFAADGTLPGGPAVHNLPSGT